MAAQMQLDVMTLRGVSKALPEVCCGQSRDILVSSLDLVCAQS